MDTPKILFTGDSAVSVQFGDAIDPAIYAHVKALNDGIKREKPAGIVETIPTFRSLMVHYDPLVLGFEQLKKILLDLIAGSREGTQAAKKVITLPICFGGEYGEDLADVAKHHETSEEKIIDLFCSREFPIYMLGFTPGYPYIGGVPDELATPRLTSPRLKVPEGSLGVGGLQLGIYPMPSPGGFRLCGRTPVKIYNPALENPVLLEAGEYVRFVPITPEEYKQIEQQVAAGTYTCQIEEG